VKISIDTELSQVVVFEDGKETVLPFACAEAFRYISAAWLRIGWDLKYVYSFTWMGRPIIQLPEDVLRIQEAIYRLKPDVIIETGIAHGGSLIFYASLCKAMEKGRVIGIDIEIRPRNREAIEAHELYPYVTLIEGGSTDPNVVNLVKSMVEEGETVLVILDSNHSKAHVLGELEAYAPLVTPGSYIVATDGIMKDLVGAPRSQPDWAWNNPFEAAKEFAAKHLEFCAETPPRVFNEGGDIANVTYWPQAWLLRR
jgi:cephalosporin hydroxylase